MNPTSIPKVNNEYLNELKKTHINEFNNKITNLSSDVKNKLLDILSIRLTGILPKKRFDDYSLEWSSVQFDKYSDYLEDFNNQYFSFEKFTNDKIDGVLHKNIFKQMRNISNAHEKINNLDNLNIKKAKKLMVSICELNDNYNKSVISLQHILIINGIKEFITIINNLYPNSIDYMYDKITTELNEKKNFYDVVNIFVGIIKKYLNNYIVSNKDLLDKKITNDLSIEYSKIENNVKCIFWIVYCNELKYYDDIIKLYNVNINYVSNQFDKIESEFDENEKEILYGIEKNISFLSDIILSNVRNKLRELKKNNDNSVSNEMINNTINNLIDNEIDSIIKNHLSDPDEIIIVRSQLNSSKSIIKLNLTLEDTCDFLIKLIGKK